MLVHRLCVAAALQGEPARRASGGGPECTNLDLDPDWCTLVHHLLVLGPIARPSGGARRPHRAGARAWDADSRGGQRGVQQRVNN